VRVLVVLRTSPHVQHDWWVRVSQLLRQCLRRNTGSRCGVRLE
jgi:hypothetical protein